MTSICPAKTARTAAAAIQIAASHAIMGIDTQLIEDGTYFVIEMDGSLAGCGGWSRRATFVRR